MNILKFIIAIAIPPAVGFTASFTTLTAINGWYATLTKPWLNPPNWIFSPAWMTLYILMGIALFLVWQKGWYRSKVRLAMFVFALQLTLNGTWSIVFFGLQSPGLALVNIIALIGTIIWTMILFYPISRLSTYLLVPYLIWVVFATYLNIMIVFLN